MLPGGPDKDLGPRDPRWARIWIKAEIVVAGRVKPESVANISALKVRLHLINNESREKER